MNRNDWEKQVYASELSTTARCIALVVGSFGNWTEERSVWPSTKAIADMAGMHRDTAQKYMDAFVEQGWLKVVKVRPGNIREYELCEADAYPLGTLAKSTRKGNLPNHQATGKDEVSDQMPNHQASSCLVEQEQLPSGAGPDAYPLGTNLKEPTNKNLLEVLEQEATVPDGPVVQDLLEVRTDDQPLPNSRTPQPSLTTRRRLTVGEMREFNRTMTNHGVSEEMAIESLELLQRSNGTTPFREALEEALQSLGVLSERSADW